MDKFKSFRERYEKEKEINEVLAESLHQLNRKYDKLVKENESLKKVKHCARIGCKHRLRSEE